MVRCGYQFHCAFGIFVRCSVGLLREILYLQSSHILFIVDCYQVVVREVLFSVFDALNVSFCKLQFCLVSLQPEYLGLCLYLGGKGSDKEAFLLALLAGQADVSHCAVCCIPMSMSKRMQGIVRPVLFLLKLGPVECSKAGTSAPMLLLCSSHLSFTDKSTLGHVLNCSSSSVSNPTKS